MKTCGLCLVFGILWAFPIHAQTRGLIATPSWPECTNPDGSGLYFDIVRAVYEPVGIQIDFEIVPWKRAESMVENSQADLMLGLFYNPQSPTAVNIPHWPFEIEETAAVYKKASGLAWEGETSLQGKLVVWRMGYNYHKFLTVNVNWSEVKTIEAGLAMVRSGRADFFMDNANGLRRLPPETLNRADFELQTVLRQYLYPEFSTRALSKNFNQIWDDRLAQLWQDGSLAKIFQKYHRNLPVLEPRAAD